jgi:hypothetical protein
MDEIIMKKWILIITALIFSSSVSAGEISNLRDARYCEVFLGFNYKTMRVYNTIGLNTCPEAQWEGINIEKIKKETGATLVHLNGPRKWIIDGMKNSTLISSEIKEFNGIAMREAGVLDLPLRFLFKKPKPYTQMRVQRNTTWIYKAQKPVYELVDAKGNVFVMQSYSLQKEIKNEDSLKKLADQLTLPKGWSFRIRVLDKDYFLTPINQTAVILQDNMLNTYQMEVS